MFKPYSGLKRRMSMDNFQLNNMYRSETPTDEPEDSCVIALKVYGLCRQQDCLKPHDANYDPLTDPDSESIPIGSAISRAEGDITAIGGINVTPNITPATVIQWGIANNNIKSLKIVPGTFKITKTEISEPVLSMYGQPNTWDVDIKYYFNYDLQFLDADDNVLPITLYNAAWTPTTKDVNNICAESTYKKRVNLPGGKINENAKVVMATTFLNPATTYESAYAPYVLVEAEANPLIIPGVIGTYYTGTEPQVVVYRADVNIGLFTIIKLFRLVNLLIQDTLPCIPEPCTPLEPQSPCKVFSNIPFPYDDFDPPTV